MFVGWFLCLSRSHFCLWILHSNFDDFASLQGGVGGVAIKTGGETKTDKQAEANFKIQSRRVCYDLLHLLPAKQLNRFCHPTSKFHFFCFSSTFTGRLDSLSAAADVVKLSNR